MTDDFTPDWLEAHRVDVTALRRDDVVGIGHVLTEVDALVERLRDPERAAKFGLVPPRGILFWGEPGVGKTLVARYLASRLGPATPFFEISTDELTPERIRGTLRYLAEKHPRSVLYADEIDTIGISRDLAFHDSETRLRLTALLSALDGLRPTDGPVVIAASNRPPGQLDAALVRAGRLGIRVRFDAPDEAERVELLRLFTRSVPVVDGIDWSHLARLTRGSTPADLRQAAEDAAGLAFAAERPMLAEEDLLAAVRRSGHIEPESDGADEVRRRIAIHEGGHVAAVVATEGPASVYAVRTGAAGGSTSFGDERVPATMRPDRIARHGLVIAYAGIEAERLLLGDTSAGGESDVTGATAIALRRISAGLADGCLPVDLNQLGRNVADSLKDELAASLSAQLESARDRAQAIVAANRDAIARFADALEAAGELTGEALADAIAQARFAGADASTAAVAGEA